MGEETDFDKLDNFVEMACNHGRGSQYANFKLVAFDQRDLEFAKLVWERYRSAQFPFYLSLGNPYPPGQDVGITDTTLQSELVNRYKQLWEDIQSDSILSKMRFLPQWHVFVWGNARGK
jgi:organic radical activating enzyme